MNMNCDLNSYCEGEGLKTKECEITDFDAYLVANNMLLLVELFRTSFKKTRIATYIS